MQISQRILNYGNGIMKILKKYSVSVYYDGGLKRIETKIKIEDGGRTGTIKNHLKVESTGYGDHLNIRKVEK